MSAHELHLLSRAKMFNGHQEQYRCFSETCQTDMTFGIYLPPQVLKGYPAPVLYFLSGLHGDGSELIRQTGIQRFAAQWNIIVVFPDTSPRGSHISDSANEFIGQGAGFYVDAAEQPWAAHYQMYSHISRELPDWVERHFPATQERSIAGFSMGGHGALSIALKNPSRYVAVSAFAPLCHPTASRGGKQAFAAYLGAESEAWQAYDSASLVQTTSRKLPILIDQGSIDPLFPDELQPEAFVNAARANGFNVQYKVRPGYGHDYFFIASFIDSHIEFHAEALGL
ncbi:S-formylglutathione hydrolase [Neisseria mucosa]|uniref:S-formylglutathione hydrolase n=1 Tax=Morococcus cerebrosus TaxID=1056807 RepID=A0A0C1GZI9_9NEIS|nr:MULTISPECIES: S-formylglutathione hydrolase [Neisseriaceae]AVR78919.1 S-formylglutathione hydrolase [Neisseria mucosa]KIC10831.1 S-formylglutathione hydrolase [Morococcus cerebrosus]OFT23593.1 S-formylglutathione hydrolase [Neisseria sp. HMSC03D10]UNV88365.1 S-formylglutathione hydrolase [Morococcus cerebrosus]